jgi:hypothetical protein
VLALAVPVVRDRAAFGEQEVVAGGVVHEDAVGVEVFDDVRLHGGGRA